MIIKIDLQSEKPIYSQVVNQVIEGIASKTLAEGESLPSVRQLAEDIGINMHTVNKAYSILRRCGFVTIHRRKGVVVNEFSNMHNSGFIKEIPEIIKPLIAEAFCKGITEKEFLNECSKIYSIFKT
ncbi:MAG TPA: GntR family transcriptional regulator [Ignavibacteriaceae bacterium]|nr:GntR family transcriptional regulator [Ignavibacteriaceae bacterium]